MFSFADNTMNLDDFIDMSPDEGEGEVMDFKTFVKAFSGITN